MAEERKPQLHVSALNMLSFCGEQYRRRYIEREIIPPGIALVTGTGLDRAVTADLTCKIESNGENLLPEEQVADVARDAVRNEVKGNGVRLMDDEKELGEKVVVGQAVDRAVRMALLHHRELAPRLVPTHVQREWVLKLRNYPVDLAGTIDIQEQATIRDTKSSKKSPVQSAADESDQLTVYAMASRYIDGKLPDKVALDYVVDYTTEKTLKQVTKIVQLESQRTEADFTPFLRRVQVAVRAMETGVFVPVKQSDPMCSPRWCGYFDTCPYVRRGVSIAMPGGE